MKEHVRYLVNPSMFRAAQEGLYVFDMDGVCVKYDRSAYVFDADGWARFMAPGYFRDLPSDPKMVNVIADLCAAGCRVMILTKVSDDPDIGPAQVQDKKIWLANNCPFLDLDTQFLSTSGDKAEAAERFLGRRLNAQDKLTDDYNVNLFTWQEAGGTAIKYLNTLNTQSDAFVNLPVWMNEREIEMCIRTA